MVVALVIVGIIVFFIFVLVMWGIKVYNGLVTQRNRYENAFSQIDVQLKRRYDLIPNLVEIAKGYMSHEKETLEAVISARNAAYKASDAASSKPGDPNAMKKLVSAETQLGGALSRLMMVSEAYPDLKANQNMMSLQEELTTTENKVAYSRQGYNDSVMSFNTKREVFPSVIIANMFGFQKAELFEIENEKEKEAPQVKF
jgi:LemA protein